MKAPISTRVWRQARHFCNRLKAKRGRSQEALSVYLIHGGGAVKHIAEAIGSAHEREGVSCRIFPHLQNHLDLVDSNIHFLSRPGFFNDQVGVPDIHPSNKVIVNWLHGGPNSIEPRLRKAGEVLKAQWNQTQRIVVPNTTSLMDVLECGVPENHVMIIPNGVDTALFQPCQGPEVRSALRIELDIQEDAFVIGSFQRDGHEDGMPKLIKGPDTLIETLTRVHGKRPIVALLTGSGRSYVVEALKERAVPFVYRWLDTRDNIPRMYHAIDLYLISSREEGGPAALRESMASGVPVVSTRMGLSLDLIENGKNGFLAEVEDSEGLAARVMELIDSDGLRNQFSEEGRKTILPLDFRIIAERYRKEIYAGVFA